MSMFISEIKQLLMKKNYMKFCIFTFKNELNYNYFKHIKLNDKIRLTFF